VSTWCVTRQWSSVAFGSTPIVAATGVKYKHVTYDGGNPAVVATVAGETEVTTQLAVEQAEMIRLAYFNDLSHSDIAARLGVPLGTVKSRLRLAMSRLRTKFADKG
jgi:hypothetical protein